MGWGPAGDGRMNEWMNEKQANVLLKRIDREEKWKWARNAENKGEVERKIEAVHNHFKGDWAQNFILCESRKLKARFGNDNISLWKEFVDGRNLVDDLGVEVLSLLGRNGE